MKISSHPIPIAQIQFLNTLTTKTPLKIINAPLTQNPKNPQISYNLNMHTQPHRF